MSSGTVDGDSIANGSECFRVFLLVQLRDFHHIS